MFNMEERLKFYYDVFKSQMSGVWDDELIMKNAQYMYEKEKSIKKGNNVLHIEYLEGILIQKDLEEIEKVLQTTDIELSSYDKSNVPYNSLNELTGVIKLILNSKISEDIFIGVVGNAVWDAMCKVFLLTYNKIKGKKYHERFSGGKIKSKNANMSLVIRKTQTTSIEYVLEGETDSEEQKIVLFTKIREHAKAFPISPTLRRGYKVKANFENLNIEDIDELKYIEKIIKKQKKKEAKKRKTRND